MILEATGTKAALDVDVIGVPAVMFVPEAVTVNVALPGEGVPLVMQFSSVPPLKTDMVVAEPL